MLLRLLPFTALIALSPGAHAEGPERTAPNGPPPFGIDLVSDFDERLVEPRHAFGGDPSTPLLLVVAQWSEETERFLEVRLHDPLKKKDLKIFGPIRQSAAGAGERSTKPASRRAAQAKLDAALAGKRFRPGSTSEARDDDAITATVGSLRVFAWVQGDELVVSRKLGEVNETRRIRLVLPARHKKLCDISQSVDAVRLHTDDNLPWAVVDLRYNCESMNYMLSEFEVPVVVDLR